MLRVTDILTDNIITECLNWDKDDDLNRKKEEPQGLHLKKLIQVIRSCGISFDVWEQRNADGKASGKYDWTSLLGTDKRIMLEALPDKLKSCLHPQTSDAVVKVWKGFGNLYRIVNNWAPDKEPNAFFSQAKGWISNFLELNGKREGYERRRITPYMHIMVAHIPKFLEKYKNVKIFTGQGVERNNDVACSVILRKSNKWDSAGDVLRQEHRQWVLHSREREVRSYVKRKPTYWDEEIREKRQNKRKSQGNQQSSEADPELHTSQPTSLTEPDFEKMSVKELKNELKQKNGKGFSHKKKLNSLNN